MLSDEDQQDFQNQLDNITEQDKDSFYKDFTVLKDGTLDIDGLFFLTSSQVIELGKVMQMVQRTIVEGV